VLRPRSSAPLDDQGQLVSGYKPYRKGRRHRFNPVLERLSVRQISARYLSQDERIEIADPR
jgi:transposase, IS30 family